MKETSKLRFRYIGGLGKWMCTGPPKLHPRDCGFGNTIGEAYLDYRKTKEPPKPEPRSFHNLKPQG